MKYVIGVDCGGTKTETEAYNLAGASLAKEITGFGNVLVNYKQALINIRLGVEGVLAKLDKHDCQQLVFGIAGIDSGGLKNDLISEFAYLKLPLVFLNDGQLAHYSILRGKDGIVVTAGTGSVFLGRNQKLWYRVGGWGALLGDEGSAYYLAKRAVQTCLKEFDYGEEPSGFSQKVFNYFAVADALSLTKKIYQLEKGQIAGLAGIVDEMAQGDPKALTLVKEAGEDLANGVIVLAKKMSEKKQPMQVGLNGSVIEKSQIIRQTFFAELRKQSDIQEFEFMNKTTSCAKGAYYYYLNELALSKE